MLCIGKAQKTLEFRFFLFIFAEVISINKKELSDEHWRQGARDIGQG